MAQLHFAADAIDDRRTTRRLATVRAANDIRGRFDARDRAVREFGWGKLLRLLELEINAIR